MYILDRGLFVVFTVSEKRKIASQNIYINFYVHFIVTEFRKSDFSIRRACTYTLKQKRLSYTIDQLYIIK